MWILFALGASLFWGMSYVLSEEIYKKISVFTALSIMSLAVFFLTLIIAHFTGNLKPDLAEIASSKRLMWYVLGGIAALLIAELFIGFSIVSKNATLAGLIEISYPIFIALFSYLFFKNNVTVPTIVGGIVIFIGVFIIYYFNH